MWVIRSRGDKIKTLALSGAMIEQGLYLHGDATSVISGLAGPYVNNVSLLSPEGNFGKRIAPTAFSAPRYTYVAKPSYIEDLLYRDIELVPTVPNYDHSSMEPITFLPIIPLILLNGVDGIGLGWATTIFPRRLGTIIDATLDVIDGNEPRDLPVNYAWAECEAKFLENHKNGGVTWQFEGSVEFVDTSTVRITNIPPHMKIEKLREHLIFLEENGKIKDYDDNSSNKIDVLVKFQRGSVRQWMDSEDGYQKALEFFKLIQRGTENFVVFDWGGYDRIVKYHSADGDPAKRIVKDFVNWRFGWYRRRYERLVQMVTADLAYWKLRKICHESGIGERAIRAKDREEIVGMIVGVSDGDAKHDHVDRISRLPIYEWTESGLESTNAEISRIEALVEEYTSILKSDSKMRSIFRKEVSDLRKKMKGYL